MLGVRAYHAIFTAYGFWLPNDPRGSWSEVVRKWEIFLAGGPATKITTRRSVAGVPHDYRARQRAKLAMTYPPVSFNGHQALAVGNGFARMIAKAKYQVFACSILPEHIHMVIGRYHYPIETVVRLLKAEASAELNATGLHPMGDWPQLDGSLPSPWARNCWKVFLNTDDDIARAIQYVENNPIKDGKRPQRWSFVTPFSAGS